jgi:HPt (histidine-containing phosphotransfer) domain-containing protein
LFDGGRILVDGALVSNVPADVVARRHSGRIIAVDVSIPRKRSIPDEYDELVPSGWQILWRRLNPFLEPLRVPGIHEILVRSTLIGGSESHRRARELADLLIQPPVSGYGLLDFHAIDRLIEIGYEHTNKELASMGKASLQALFSSSDVAPPELAHISSAPLDRALFNEILGVDDDEAYREMVGLFLEMFPSEIESIAEAVWTEDLPKVRERAHRARSAAASVAAATLTDVLQKLDDLARNRLANELPDCVEKVRAEFRRIEVYHNGAGHRLSREAYSGPVYDQVDET